MYEERLKRVAASLQQHSLQAVALTPGPSLYYLTGLSFHMMERPTIGLFTAHARPHLILPELEAPKAEGAGLDIHLHPYGEEEVSRSQVFAAAFASLDLARARVGVEPLRMRIFELRLMEAAAPGAAFVSGEPALHPLRMTKDEAEVTAMRRAVAIAEAALAATLPRVQVGMTERDLAAEMTLQLLHAGSDTELPFPTIVASGPNSALPHAVPGDRRLQPGDLLILDWGARFDGYISDLTRTFAVGEIDPPMAHIHEIVQQANAAGRWAVRPGATCGDVDRAARSIIAAAGYGEHFVHRTGHGIGLEAHEPPYIRGDSQEPLAPGMTFTVEPGIYLPGRGGVRVEDDVLVTADGVECLTSLPRELRYIP